MGVVIERNTVLLKQVFGHVVVRTRTAGSAEVMHISPKGRYRKWLSSEII